MKTPARVAIVGRPNVGKSTLFNRITGGRRALVHPTPGVTRDAQSASADWNGVVFDVIDTGGLFSGIEDRLVHEIEARAMEQAMGSDLLVFVTDAVAGVTPSDADIARRLRGAAAPVLVAVNKAEKSGQQHAEVDFYQLGFDRVFPISALHGQGVGDLLDAVVAELPEGVSDERTEDLKLAIVGRPNVGKSSLTNALVGKEQAIVDSRPGTTRDSVDLQIRWHGRHVTLVDTAGLRRKSRSRDGLTSLTALKSIDAIARADVVVMVLDASEEIANQDVTVASYAHKAGKGLVICVNKWDLVENKTNATVPQFERAIRESFSFAPYAIPVFVSALTRQRVSRLLELAWRIKSSREMRVPTSELNRVIETIVRRDPPPSSKGGTARIYYGTQVDVCPPTFALFVNRRDFFHRSYLRFLNNRLRERYSFEGTVIRIKLVEKEKRERHA